MLESKMLEFQKNFDSQTNKDNQVPNNHLPKASSSEFIKINNEFIEHLSDISSNVQLLIRSHNENRNVTEAWQKHFDKIPVFEDFVARHSSPYLLEYEDEIKQLAKALNSITKMLEVAMKNNKKTYNCDFDIVIQAVNVLKKKVYLEINKS